MEQRERFRSLQAMRGCATCTVILNHAFVGATLTALPGALVIPPRLLVLCSTAVDMFFVMSGFVLFYIALPWTARGRSVGEFYILRLIRVWPPYAIATAVTCVLLVARAVRNHALPFDLQPLRLAGFVFVPSFDAHGNVVPIVVVGWTLTYEFFFYTCLAIAMLGPARGLLARLAAIVAMAIGLGALIPHTALGVFLTNAITIDVLTGGAIACVRPDRLLSPRQAWLAIGAGLLLVLACMPFPGVQTTIWRPLAYGLPVTLVLIGALALESLPWPGWLVFLGNASYSLYLSHSFVIDPLREPLRAVWREHGWPLAAVLPSIVLMAFAIAVGALCFAWIECPLMYALRRAYARMSGRTLPTPIAAQRTAGERTAGESTAGGAALS